MKRFLFLLLAFSAVLCSAEGELMVPDTLAEPVLPEARIFPEGATRARWLWRPEFPETLPETVCFRYKFNLPEPVKSASMRLCFEVSATCFVNGKLLPITRFEPQRPRGFPVKTCKDLAAALHNGENLMAFEVTSSKSIYGLIVAVDVELASGKHVYLGSDAHFCTTVSPAKEWNALLTFDDSNWQKPRELGDAWALPWSREGDVAELLSLENDKIRQKKILENELALPESIASEPKDPNAKIVYNGKIPGIEVNGKVLPPFIMIHRETPLSTKEADVIIKAYRREVRFFDVLCRTDVCFTRPGEYDFSKLDHEIRRILHLAPEGYVIINFRVHRLAEFLVKYPEEAVGFRTGPPENERTDDLFGNRPLKPSSASGKMRSEIRAMIRELGKYVNSNPWGKRVAGLRLSYGVYSEWQIYGHRSGIPDCGKAMTNAFRNYLAAKYGSDKALQQAWGDLSVTLKTAEAPTLKEFQSQTSFVIDPAPGQIGRKFLDHYDNLANNMLDMLIMMAKCAKEAMPGRIMGAYYGYPLSFHYSPNGQNALLEKALSSPYIDFLSRPYGYSSETRAPGGNAFNTVSAVFHRHKKLCIVEADIRTHLARPWSEKHLRCQTAAETESVTQRDLSNSLIYGAGIQFLHFGGTFEYKNPNWFNTAAFLNPLKRGVELWRENFTSPAKDNSEVAVVISPENMIRHGMPDWRSGEYIADMLYYIGWQRFARGGVPFEILTMNDFFISGRDYKAVIFLNAVTLTADERMTLIKQLRRPGVTAFWYYAPGLADGDKGLSEKAMSDVTGIQLRADWEPGLLSVLTREGFSFGARTAEVMHVPRVYADDPKADVRGTYRDTGQPVLVRKAVGKGCYSVFSGASISDLRALIPLLEQAGVHVWCRPERYEWNTALPLLRADSRYLLFHTGRENRGYTIALPRKVSLLKDAFTGETIVENTERITLQSNGSRTWLLVMDPENK